VFPLPHHHNEFFPEDATGCLSPEDAPQLPESPLLKFQLIQLSLYLNDFNLSINKSKSEDPCSKFNNITSIEAVAHTHTNPFFLILLNQITMTNSEG
jgi:hypothetical protein